MNERERLRTSSKRSNASTENGLSAKRENIRSIINNPGMVVTQSISELRHRFLRQLIADSSSSEASYRVYMWSIFLNVEPQSHTRYVELLKKGPSDDYDKIRNDTFRTLATDNEFKAKVPEESLIRLLNSFVWSQKSRAKSSDKKSGSVTYLQGMNVVAAPFLYVARSESQAFYLYEAFLTKFCPLYTKPSLPGVHAAIELVDICLEIIDPALYKHLSERYVHAELYGFAPLLTFLASLPPLSEVIRLWDLMFAYGYYFNVLFVVAHVNSMRRELMASKNPLADFRSQPQIVADDIHILSLGFLKKIPQDVYDMLVRHGYDPKVADDIAKYKLRRKTNK